MQRPDHVLLIGFGGPESPEEVRHFLERLTQGTRVPLPRLREVESHYQVTGGFSPYNAHARRLAEALRARSALPVFLGMRNWRPFLSDALREVEAAGLRRGTAVVLAPHRSEASFGRYLKSLEESVQGSAPAAEYETLPAWHDHPLFVEAQADRVRPLLNGGAGAHLLFTAHSIPVEMAGASSYAAEVEASSRAVAEAVGRGAPAPRHFLGSGDGAASVGAARWSVAYQSRSGPPGQPWLGPDVAAELCRLNAAGVRTVVAVPIGFLFDHTEVLYDLDVEAKQAAESQGLEFLRAPTVMDHPQFVRMLAELIKERKAG